jgi:hypothetical protein
LRNVTSLVYLAGTVLERVYTTPYGEPTFDTYTINGDGDIDPSDDSNLTTGIDNALGGMWDGASQ